MVGRGRCTQNPDLRKPGFLPSGRTWLWWFGDVVTESLTLTCSLEVGSVPGPRGSTSFLLKVRGLGRL